MPELQVIEARVPERTPARAALPQGGGRLAPIAAMLSGPVFTRARDIFAANMTDLLDRAEDPSRTIRMIIVEMEETLVDVRASAARAIADIKEMQRALSRLDAAQAGWTERAELALEKGREDLARAALTERNKAAEIAESLSAEMRGIETVLRDYEADIAKLQAKLREARARQQAIATRFDSAMARAKARELVHGTRTQDAFSRFELLERRADLAEAQTDALGLGGQSLEDQIADLRSAEKVDAELEAMKAARAAQAK